MEEAIRKAAVLIEAMPYIQRFAGKAVVIKFGGNAMENDRVLDDVVEDIVFLAAVGIRPVVVHGGGPQISEAMKAAGIEPNFVQGLRVTDEKTLKVAVRVLSQDINAALCRRVEKFGGRAHPTFAAGRTPLRARKKLMAVPGPGGKKQKLDLGFVGEVTSVDARAMMAVAAKGAVLVVPPIGQDRSGQLYNVNADTAAAAVAAGLKAEKIVFLSNVHGIMADPADPASLLSTVAESAVEQMIADGVITGGMLPKVAACIRALDGGVGKAHIVDGRLPHSLLLEIFTDKGIGTQIVKDV